MQQKSPWCICICGIISADFSCGNVYIYEGGGELNFGIVSSALGVGKKGMGRSVPLVGAQPTAGFPFFLPLPFTMPAKT